jgi:ATP synthase protein I
VSQEDKNAEETRQTSRAYAAGISLFATVAVCLFLGWALDRWMDTSPWLLVTGIVLGSVLGLWEFIRLSTPKDENEKK